MKKPLVLIMAALVLCFSSCSKKYVEPSFESQILGNWMAVDDSYDPIASEWGFVYEGSIKLYPDHSFAENVGAGMADSSVVKMGTWDLKDNNSSIVFYSAMADQGTIRRDTTEFSISIDSTNKLILKNSKNTILHKRIE